MPKPERGKGKASQIDAPTPLAIAIGWAVELRMRGLQSPDPMDMSFAEIWTHWRALRGIDAQRIYADAMSARLAQADTKTFKKFRKEMGHG